jgi:hypothetical protein
LDITYGSGSINGFVGLRVLCILYAFLIIHITFIKLIIKFMQ